MSFNLATGEPTPKPEVSVPKPAFHPVLGYSNQESK